MEQVAEGIFVETSYESVNVGAIQNGQQVIAVDTPSYPRDARHWAMKLHQFSHRPPQFLVLTDGHGDRILNTRWLYTPIIAHQTTIEKMSSYDRRYPQTWLESLMTRNPNRARDLSNVPVERPTLSFSHRLHIYEGEREIVLTAAPGPTPGNIWIYLPDCGVLFSGDTVVANVHPLLVDGNSEQWLATLAQLQQWPYEIAAIVPGRGPVCDKSTVQSVHNYIWNMRDRIRQHCKAERPREETSAYVQEFLAMFPTGNLPVEWVERQIKLSLDRVYDEIKLTINGTLATQVDARLLS